MKPANFPARKATRQQSAAARVIHSTSINGPERAYEKEAVILNYALIPASMRTFRTKKLRTSSTF